MPEKIYQKTIKVGSEVIDRNGHVNNVVYVDVTTGRPRRIPKAMADFVMDGE